MLFLLCYCTCAQEAISPPPPPLAPQQQQQKSIGNAAKHPCELFLLLVAKPAWQFKHAGF